jgi:hypothetical protein
MRQIKTLLLLLLICFAVQTNGQDFKPEYKKHGFFQNIIPGHRLRMEIPIELSFAGSKDTYYSGETAQQNLVFFGSGIKLGLRNDSYRGFAIGAGMEKTWNLKDDSLSYLRYNIMLDLDFLFLTNYTKHKNPKKIQISLLNKFMLSMITGEENDEKFREFYLRFYYYSFYYKNFMLAGGFNAGIFREKHPPRFADAGLIYTLSYTIR